MCGYVCANALAGEICDHSKVKLAEQQMLFQVCLRVCHICGARRCCLIIIRDKLAEGVWTHNNELDSWSHCTEQPYSLFPVRGQPAS